MRVYRIHLTILIQFAVIPVAAHARTNVVVVHNFNETSTAAFKLRVVSPPSSDDAATKSAFSIVDGRRDGNGADLEKLHDGKLPREADQPSENFFFDAGTSGGRLLVDLGQLTAIDQVNTYSWHRSTRARKFSSFMAAMAKARALFASRSRGPRPSNPVGN